MASPRLSIRAANASLAIAGGRIVPAEGSFDAELSFPGCEVRPGLINAHDHLHRNHYGRLGTPPYRDAYAWGEDIQQACRAGLAPNSPHSDRRIEPRGGSADNNGSCQRPIPEQRTE